MKIGTKKYMNNGKLRDIAIYEVQDKGSSTCSSCKKIKSNTEFIIARSMRNGRGTLCKKCNIYRVNARAAYKRAEERPHLYAVCNKCDWVFCKYGKGGALSKKLTSCSKCGSKEIEDYREKRERDENYKNVQTLVPKH